GLEVLRNLTPGLYNSLNTGCDHFVETTNVLLNKIGAAAHLSYYHSMISFRFRKAPVYNYIDAKDASSSKIYDQLFHYLLKAGVYMPPADLESFFVSMKHTDLDLKRLTRYIVDFFKSHQGVSNGLSNGK
ncbi:MAG: hypothetical protein HQL13_06875, partial [Candidatus Omnitrophica bacterium]|nr:hypothetical protein [Candidatus Omnitrophota bacterium]